LPVSGSDSGWSSWEEPARPGHEGRLRLEPAVSGARLALRERLADGATQDLDVHPELGVAVVDEVLGEDPAAAEADEDRDDEDPAEALVVAHGVHREADDEEGAPGEDGAAPPRAGRERIAEDEGVHASGRRQRTAPRRGASPRGRADTPSPRGQCTR